MSGGVVAVRGAYQGRTAIIAGAAVAPGPTLARRLAGQGATVIAMDDDECALNRLARGWPQAIEPLPLEIARRESCRLLGRSWGAEPVALLVNLHALAQPRSPGSNARAIGWLCAALRPGLAAGQGSVVTVLVPPAPGADPMEQAAQAVLERRVGLLPDELGGDGIRANAVSAAPGLIAAQPGMICDPVLFLGGPGARGITGAVLPVRALPGAD